MATSAEINEVRINTAEPENTEPYTDSYISGLVDGLGVRGASASIWRSKAANYASLVDVTEAGASHKMSDMFKHAMEMWETFGGADSGGGSAIGPIVRVIERST